ncbi:secretin N-terminal domain-containing protein [Marinobacter sp. BGYM27]|uniref:secretin N-terminal domain-containing protein n=1 Tax=Marinobacter sp. BGYM27 TaxID=2975597 RepID=UPI0021A5B524|nr:secretin N-terminal domain-containing protein [Marinobacter sp. BGYM27]MDG5501421.1 secretin [Marinobacter sp. BGYM27]
MIRNSLLALILMVLTPLALAAPELRTYSLQNRPADDVAAQLHQLYPDELSISSQAQTLIVRAEPRVLDEISTLIETMDVAAAQLRITVRSGNAGDSNRQGGGITINNGNVSVQGERKVITTRRNREQSLIVQDGQAAHIKSGSIQTLPIAISGGFNPAAILQQVDISSGFVISPRVISGQQVELQIMAFDNTPQGDLPAGYETEAVMTLRRVSPGEWVELGSTDTRQAGNQSGITYEVGGSRQSSQSFSVKVDVLR